MQVHEEEPMEDLITVAEAAALGHVDPKTVRRWYREGKVTKHVTGTGRVRVSRTEIIKLTTPAPVVTGAGA